jgi:hypothetical protein
MLDKVAMPQAFFSLFDFTLIIIMPLLLRIHLVQKPSPGRELSLP